MIYQMLIVVPIHIYRRWVQRVYRGARNTVGFARPFTQINEFAALAAKRTERKFFRPFEGVVAGWTGECGGVAHNHCSN